jgi:stage II sporulation protein M
MEVSSLLYKAIDAKLEPLRETDYTYWQLLVFSMRIFAGAIIIGILLNQVLAVFAYRYFLAPTLDVINWLSALYDNPFWLMLIIFFKNSLAVVLCICLARRTRGISISLLLGLNGLIIGSVLTMWYLTDLSLAMIIVGIMPHGIFEFTAVFLGSAYGLKLLLTRESMLQKYNTLIKHKIIRILIPLLLLAACIEAYITPVFMSLVQ